MGTDTYPLPGGYALQVGSNFDYTVHNAKGKALARLPAKLKKTPEVQQLAALEASHALRRTDHARTIEGWMLGDEPVPVSVVAALRADPCWSAPLAGLLVEVDGQKGLLTGGDAASLELTDAAGRTSVDGGALRIPHPARLGDLAAWRDTLRQLGISQGVRQLLRPVQRPDDTEASRRSSGRFSEQTLTSAVRASYAFGDLGWSTARGIATRDVVVHGDAPTCTRVAFQYFAHGEDYGDWNQECETGELTFEAGGAALRMREVPPAVFSEACIDITHVLRRAR